LREGGKKKKKGEEGRIRPSPANFNLHPNRRVYFKMRVGERKKEKIGGRKGKIAASPLLPLARYEVDKSLENAVPWRAAKKGGEREKNNPFIL